MPEYCVAPGHRHNYRVRIYRQCITFLLRNGYSEDNIKLISFLTGRTKSDIVLDYLRAMLPNKETE
jgi:hypothetical protein